MANWVYQLKRGKDLREAIRNEDKEETLNQLAKCWKEINENLPDVYDEDDLSEDLEYIDIQLGNLENPEDYGMSELDIRDEIDYLLQEFYDFCDNMRIWVEID